MNILGLLMVAGFREAIRNRVTVVVAAFAGITILLTSVVLNLTIFSLDRVVTDFGLGVMSLLLTAISLFLSVGMLSREIERRTVFLVMSRPLARGQFVLGRYLGIVLTLTVLLLGMTLIYFSQLALFGVQATEAIAYAIAGLWLELLLLSAMGLFFSSFSGPVTATVVVTALYFIGHWAPDLYLFSKNLKNPLLAQLAGMTYHLVPNLDRVDFKVAATYGASVDGGAFLQGAAAVACWLALFLGGAVGIFERRDFK